MNKYERFDRIIKEIDKNRYPSIHDLCRMFEKSERAIYDDLAYLRDLMEVDIRFDKTRGGYFNGSPDKKLPQFNLSVGELFAITLGKDMLTEYGGTSLEPILRSAIDKIEERLPEKVKADLPTLVGPIRFKAGGIIPLDRAKFFDLRQACEERHVVYIEYVAANNGQATFRNIEPLRVLEHLGAWYIVAYCQTRSELRRFALHRITSYKVEKETFAERPDIDVDAHIEQAFLLEHGSPAQTFEIKFDQAAARYVREREWHQSQQLVENTDGGCTLSFLATSLDEVKRWVLGFGAHAEVVQPEKLRQNILDEFLAGAAIYSSKPKAVRAKSQPKRAMKAPKAKSAAKTAAKNFRTDRLSKS